MQESEELQALQRQGFFSLKTLEDETICGLAQVGSKTALYIGLSLYGFERRYCYPCTASAKRAMEYITTGDSVAPRGYTSWRNG